jgi:hypothetical protein
VLKSKEKVIEIPGKQKRKRRSCFKEARREGEKKSKLNAGINLKLKYEEYTFDLN